MVPGDMASFGRHRRLADSDDSDDENTTTKNILTTAKASDLCPKPHRLIARNEAFSSMEDMSTLSALDYVDLTGNALKSVQGLSSNPRLKTIILKNNKLSDVQPLLKTASLQILDISDNEFVTTEWLPMAAFVADLVALVARGNKLVALEGFRSLRRIQTLVISDNQIEDLSPVTHLTSLTKLSASKNCIRLIPDSIANLHNLRELRLAHNRLAALPSKETLARLSSLKLLDIGHNRIASVDHLSACTDELKQLNAAGNPACSTAEDFTDYLRKLCPKLEVVDGQRVAGGRRKLRVNRQRVAAGLPLEPDRKFARPPSAYYVRKAGDKKEGTEMKEHSSQGPTDNSRNRIFHRKDSKRKAPVMADVDVPDGPINATKKTRRNAADDEDDDALDPNQFVKMAQANSLLPPNTDSQSVTLDKGLHVGSKSKSKRRKAAVTVEHEERVEFGSGGASKW